MQTSDCLRAVDAADAEKKQEILRYRCKVERMTDTDEIRLIPGADAAYDQDTIYAAVVVMTFPGLMLLKKPVLYRQSPFPIFPGFWPSGKVRLSWMRSGPSLRFPISS